MVLVLPQKKRLHEGSRQRQPQHMNLFLCCSYSDCSSLFHSTEPAATITSESAPAAHREERMEVSESSAGPSHHIEAQSL